MRLPFSFLLFSVGMISSLGGVTSSSLAGSIGIDFGCGVPNERNADCEPGDAPLQTGYLGWNGAYTGSGLNYNETLSFSSDIGISGLFNLNVVSDELYFRDYSAITGSYETQSNLLSDNILRNTAGSISFAFSGLSAGVYSMESFHHDSIFGSTNVPFDVEISDALGALTAITGADTSGGTSPTSITALLYSFTVGNDGIATILFRTAFAVPGEHMSINGFLLTGPTPVPIPAALPLFAAGLSVMGFMGWRKRRRTGRTC